MTDPEEFCKTYKALGGVLSGYFYDSDDDESDEALAARIIAGELPHPGTADLLVADSETALRNVDRDWVALGKTANRDFENVGEAREWLSRISSVWSAALRRPS